MARKRRDGGVHTITPRKSSNTGVKSVAKKVADPGIPLRLMLPTRYIRNGSESGRKYEWSGSGSIVTVDSNDAEFLLSLTSPRACCGGKGQGKVFEIVT